MTYAEQVRKRLANVGVSPVRVRADIAYLLDAYEAAMRFVAEAKWTFPGLEALRALLDNPPKDTT